MGSWSWAIASMLAGVLSADDPEPLPVVGGQDAQTCQWPAAVALEKFGSIYCTASLIHPQVILTAAHCLHPDGGWGIPDSVNFGENGLAPERTTGIFGCGIHPFYVHDAELHSPEDAHDLAYCILDEPVADIRPTPMIMGCEVAELQPDKELYVVGFGADSFSGETPQGIGTKRWIVQTLEEIDDQDQLFLLGGMGSSCSGDSGGPAYVQLADGSWRVVAAAARVHPDAPPDPPYCEYGVVYTGAWNEMWWAEAETGFDVTPCFDTDGNWDPGPDCAAFPTDLLASADWADGCVAQPTADPTPIDLDACAEPTGDTGDSGDSGGSDSGGLDDGTGDGTTTDGGDEDCAVCSTSTDSVADETSATPSDTSSGDSTGGDGAQQSSDRGCGCRHRERTPPWLLLVLAPAWLRRPGRRPIRRRGR